MGEGEGKGEPQPLHDLHDVADVGVEDLGLAGGEQRCVFLGKPEAHDSTRACVDGHKDEKKSGRQEKRVGVPSACSVSLMYASFDLMNSMNFLEKPTLQMPVSLSKSCSAKSPGDSISLVDRAAAPLRDEGR